ncbi:zinc ribbon domain-containing protein [Bacillus proteolyticus]|uniref:zinc ribbon domain-containing protein n=1 Tax=Bacillus proteolyticus TaxID=2026192 RepID=UPI003D0382FD
MYCSNCGENIDKEASICPHCGVTQKFVLKDRGGFGWGVLGCCVPIVGLILYLVWRDEKPKSAKAAGIGALIPVGLFVAFYGILFLIGFFSYSW